MELCTGQNRHICITKGLFGLKSCRLFLHLTSFRHNSEWRQDAEILPLPCRLGTRSSPSSSWWNVWVDISLLFRWYSRFSQVLQVAPKGPPTLQLDNSPNIEINYYLKIKVSTDKFFDTVRHSFLPHSSSLPYTISGRCQTPIPCDILTPCHSWHPFRQRGGRFWRAFIAKWIHSCFQWFVVFIAVKMFEFAKDRFTTWIVSMKQVQKKHTGSSWIQ